MIGQYILDENKQPVLEPDPLKWAKWYETYPRHVADDKLPNGVRVSTVFLGLDHSFSVSSDHVPILFETMVFGGQRDHHQDRYATWEEAVIGHAEILETEKLNCPQIPIPKGEL